MTADNKEQKQDQEENKKSQEAIGRLLKSIVMGSGGMFEKPDLILNLTCLECGIVYEEPIPNGMNDAMMLGQVSLMTVPMCPECNSKQWKRSKTIFVQKGPEFDRETLFETLMKGQRE